MTAPRARRHQLCEGRKKYSLRSKLIESGIYRIHADGLTFEITKEANHQWHWVVKDGLGMWDYKVYRDLGKAECIEAIQTYLNLRLVRNGKKH